MCGVLHAELRQLSDTESCLHAPTGRNAEPDAADLGDEVAIDLSEHVGEIMFHSERLAFPRDGVMAANVTTTF